MPVPWLRDARLAGWVTYCSIWHMRKYNAESRKQGRKRFNSIVKTIDFDHLVIIYLCVLYSIQFPDFLPRSMRLWKVFESLRNSVMSALAPLE